MKAIMVMFDSLNRHMLQPYGGDWVKTPNFERLAERTVRFDKAYIGSMPCMPARRELHTGRYNFLHRSWGPLEPFDDSMPEILRQNSVYTHLISDHLHYWEDGGATFHQRYSSWEIVRGQEGDLWKGSVADPEIAPNISNRNNRHWRQDWVNRQHMDSEEKQPQPQVFALGEEFIRTNKDEDNWFLQIETFDPHEPFFTQQKYKDLYPQDYSGPHFDWPNYDRVTETPDQIEHMRNEYAALMSMCDHYLGKVIDLMDELNLWEDTLLIVNTDHGFLLSEHDWWAKIRQPFYEEIAHIPLFIWDPRSGRKNESCSSLVQTIDLPATLLEYFDVARPADMQGIPLREAIASDTPTRAAVLFGQHGAHVNCTDGQYVYMRGPASQENAPLFNYTLMPTHMHSMFSPQELQDIHLAEPFDFTKGCRTMKIASKGWPEKDQFATLLYDVLDDARQNMPLDDPDIEQRMIAHLTRLMEANDAPPEQFERLGLV